MTTVSDSRKGDLQIAQTAVWRAPLLGRKFVTQVGVRVKRVFV
jgi:hypothetical protein